jgi:hypothetical protein
VLRIVRPGAITLEALRAVAPVEDAAPDDGVPDSAAPDGDDPGIARPAPGDLDR